MRRNLFQLILDKDYTNVELGILMLKTDDLHFSMFPYIWKLYRERHYYSKSIKQIEIIFDAFSKQFFTTKLAEYVREGIEDWSSYWYRIFEKTAFAELMLEEKILTWESLIEYWKEDVFYTKHSCLSRFFLEHSTSLDASIFLHPHFKSQQLQNSKILHLLESKDSSFDKLAFLKKFLEGSTLNLKNTNIRTIPIEVEKIHNINILNIYGTKVKALPISLLVRLKRLECNKKTRRAIVRQILALERYDYPLAQQVGFKRAVLLFEQKNYPAAFPFLEAYSQQIQTAFFSKKEQSYFWEMYFSCAVYLGKNTEAQEIVKRSCTTVPPIEILSWKEWRYLLPKLIIHQEEEKLFSILSPFFQRIFVIELCQLNQNRKWHCFIEDLIFRKQFDEAFKLVQIAPQYLPNLSLNLMNWIRIFSFFHQQKDYKSIIQILEQYQFLAFYKESTPILPNHQPRYYRCIAFWLSSYFKLGNYKNAELYCSILITTFEKELDYKGTAYYRPYYLANYYIPLAYKFLSLIYEKDNHPICAAYFREKGELICQQYHLRHGHPINLDYYL